MQSWKVKYVDQLQGKTHEVIVKAATAEAATAHVLKTQRWQTPMVSSVTAYNVPVRLK